MYGKILLATDGSEHSMIAADYALEMAKHNNSQVIIIHVVPLLKTFGWSETGREMGNSLSQWEEQLMEEGKGFIDVSAGKFAAAGIPYTTKIEIGDPAEEICREAEDEKVDLIIMGTRGQGAVSRFVFGSVSKKVVTYAECPVMVIR